MNLKTLHIFKLVHFFHFDDLHLLCSHVYLELLYVFINTFRLIFKNFVCFNVIFRCIISGITPHATPCCNRLLLTSVTGFHLQQVMVDKTTWQNQLRSQRSIITCTVQQHIQLFLKSSTIFLSCEVPHLLVSLLCFYTVLYTHDLTKFSIIHSKIKLVNIKISWVSKIKLS